MTVEPTYRVEADGRIVVSHRACCRCLRLLPQEDFASNANRRRSMCRECSAFVREQRYLASLGFINLITEEIAS